MFRFNFNYFISIIRGRKTSVRLCTKSNTVLPPPTRQNSISEYFQNSNFFLLFPSLISKLKWIRRYIGFIYNAV